MITSQTTKPNCNLIEQTIEQYREEGSLKSMQTRFKFNITIFKQILTI